jgi:hypothetical protein
MFPFMHPLSRCFLIGFTFAVANASGAAIQMTEVSTNQSVTTRAEMLIDGERFKISYTEAPPGMPPDCYMVGTGPNQMFMVVPSRSAYARFDAGEFATMSQPKAGPDGEEQGPGGMTRTVENFLLKKELDEAGPAMFGLSTRHYRYTLSYKEVMKMTGMPMAMTSTVNETHEFWATMDLADAASLIALQGNGPPPAAGETPDKDAEAHRTMDAHGLKLKSIVTHKSKMGGLGGMGRMMGGGGKGDTYTSKREVVAFARVNPPAGAFALPEGLQETDMMGLFAGSRSKMPTLDEPPGTAGQKPKPRSGMPDLNSTP